MTADVELLPLPNLWKYEGSGVISARITPDDTREYARANVLHHTAAKDAEIEALRVEIVAQRTRADVMAGEAIKHEARAEWLTKTLRLALKWAEVLPVGEPLHAESVRDLDTARAALEQEDV